MNAADIATLAAARHERDIVVEVCCFHVESALVAAAAGAHRIELCHDRRLDGYTPPRDVTKSVIAAYDEQRRSHTQQPPLIHTMVRPRPACTMEAAGAAVFVLSEEEKQQCLDEVMWLGSLRYSPHTLNDSAVFAIHGIVIGALRELPDKAGRFDIDWAFVTEVVRVAKSVGIADVTLHRCFDFVHEWDVPQAVASAMDRLASLGMTRILTSGTAIPTSLDKRIARLLAAAAMSAPVRSASLAIMPAGEMGPNAVRAFLAAQRNQKQQFIYEFHGSFLTHHGNEIPDAAHICETISVPHHK
jgi:copper homeostasis protein